MAESWISVQNKEYDALEVAWRYVEHTNVNVFLTGKAGTGKTTFLHRVVAESAKTVAVVAPSGVAAINAGGSTIHSFFQLPLSPYVPGTKTEQKFKFTKNKLRVIRALDLLIIDEVSMVRADLLDAVDATLRRIRQNPRPFGGVQLLLIGDLLQLSPVLKNEESALLASIYPTPYFFDSKALQRTQYVTIELKTIFRQSDEQFIELLNHVRQNKMTSQDFEALNSRVDSEFIPPSGSDYIRLTTHNSLADGYNDEQLSRLSTKAKTYKAKVQGLFPETSFPTAKEMTLKVGAQVMFIKNDTMEHRYFNGKIGHIVALYDDRVVVQCPEDDGPIEVGMNEWENSTYTVDEKNKKVITTVQGTFRQLPLRLAWAITIHKSQGLTFDRVVIDAGRSFATGQVYVALSRCRSLEGIVLATPLHTYSVRTDDSIAGYVSAQGEAAANSVSILPQLEKNYSVSLLKDAFDFELIMQQYIVLQKIFSETFSKKFDSLWQCHLRANGQFTTEILKVSQSWLRQIDSWDADYVLSGDINDRICRGAQYFIDTFKKIFEPWFDKTAQVQSQNNNANQHIKEAYEQMSESIRAKMLNLQKIVEEGFDPENYLSWRQTSILEATAAKPKQRVRNRGKAK